VVHATTPRDATTARRLPQHILSVVTEQPHRHENFSGTRSVEFEVSK
jgi:hypothetical protein